MDILVRTFNRMFTLSQVYTGDNADKGIVKQTLDSDNKPVYAGGSHVSIVDPSEFQYWFRTIPGYNIPITQDLVFTNCDPKTTKDCNDEYYVSCRHSEVHL